MKIILPSTFSSISKVPRHPKKPPKLYPKWTLKLQNVRKWHSQKNDKKPTPKMSSKTQTSCQTWTHFSWPKQSQKYQKSRKCQNWLLRRPGVQKASKRVRKGIQKTPKGFQILSIWIPMESKSQRHNAKDCKEPCTLTELPSRKTS